MATLCISRVARSSVCWLRRRWSSWRAEVPLSVARLDFHCFPKKNEKYKPQLIFFLSSTSATTARPPPGWTPVSPRRPSPLRSAKKEVRTKPNGPYNLPFHPNWQSNFFAVATRGIAAKKKNLEALKISFPSKWPTGRLSTAMRFIANLFSRFIKR